MATPETSTVLGEVFSAIQFYRDHAAGIKRPSGLHTFSLEVPSAGLHHVRAGSLEWVDGHVVGSLTDEQFLSAIEKGELPSPCISHIPRYLPKRCTYTSAELLAHSQDTLVAAFGIVEELVESALRSSTVECPCCGEVTTRLTGASAFGDTLLREWGGQNITLEASSHDQGLATWASKAGFTLRDSAILGQPSVVVESDTCTPTLVARLAPLIRSIWGVAHLSFVCHSASAHIIYAPEGWCSRCGCLVGEVDRTILTKLLSRSPVSKEADHTAVTRIRSLRLSSNVHIRDILSKPLSDLDLTNTPILHPVCEALEALNLHSYPLSTPLMTVPSQDLALISVAISLYRSATKQDAVVIDLPSGTLQHQSALIHAICSRAVHAAHSFMVLNDPFRSTAGLPSTPYYSLQEHPITARTGEAIRLTYSRDDGLNLPQKILQNLGAHHSEQKDSCFATFVPLFPSPRSMPRVLADEVGVTQNIAQLYTSSVDARCAGLTAKDFTFGSLRTHPYLCRECRGLGVVLTWRDDLPRPLASPCRMCFGARFKTPVHDTLFRNVAYSTLLNRPLRESLETLRALPRSRDLLQYIKLLDLEHLPLGMPVALLSSSEYRRLLILKAALEARPTKVQTIIIEEPELGFSQLQREGLLVLQRLESLADRCCWIEIAMSPPPA
jgi:hypothetical protein